MVVSEFQDRRPEGAHEVPGLRALGIWRLLPLLRGQACQEVVAEISRHVHGAHQGHAQDVAIKRNARICILDSKHGLREILRLRQSVPPWDQLNPVSVGVQGKCNGLHSALVRPLLELNSLLLQCLAGGHNVRHVEGDVAEASHSSLFVQWGVLGEVAAVVPAPNFEVWVLFRAVVMGQLQRCSGHVPQVGLGLFGARRRHGDAVSNSLHEVQREFPLGKVVLVNKLHVEVLLVEGH
mmetsp:Transcript_75038/g.135159  ORF Transcript_75038/g.135159 Transcript_75038/m.135159 type:complete len:237 (-) Transcript_75038:194-904(-)